MKSIIKKGHWLTVFIVSILIFYFLIKNDFVIFTQTENGIILGKPAYEKRSISVSQTDLSIVQEAKLLITESLYWSKNGDRSCNGKTSYSLFCALKAASIKSGGKYIHRRPALQEVRFAIDDLFRNRWKVHRLAEFNSHKDTKHKDILSVLDLAMNRINQKLKK
ncbi:MAG: hypothetical protein KTR19_05170 [Hyphomicrobiales bacterium]|nr:hypothetical protein [Hyphomicrobiales bacterium]